MIPERYAPQTYALMRIVLALIVLNYGLQKFGMFGGIEKKSVRKRASAAEKGQRKWRSR